MRFVVKDAKAAQVRRQSELAFTQGDTPVGLVEFYQNHVVTDEGFEPEKEQVVVVTLNSRLKITGWNLVSLGILNEATVHPREVFRPVIAKAAYGFSLIHNHPSGDPSPSPADMRITKRLKECADMLQIEFIDHLIMVEHAPGRSPYYSFREAGML